MPSPILRLRGNIACAFENARGCSLNQLRESVEAGLISHEIDLSMEPGPPRAPYVSRTVGNPSVFALHFAHLELLWAFTYGWVVLYEEAVQRPWMAGNFDGRILLTEPLTQRAASLLEWASGLRENYADWPPQLPSPDRFSSDQEHQYALKVNGIFQDAVAFLLYHEYAHVRLGHFDVVESDAENDPLNVQLEQEADDFAFSALISQDDAEDVRVLKGWSILVPALSSLYLVDGRTRVFQRRHPHLHHRIANLLAKLNFRSAEARFYYFYLCSTVLLTFDRAHRLDQRVELSPRVFETADEAFEFEMDDLDRFLSAP